MTRPKIGLRAAICQPTTISESQNTEVLSRELTFRLGLNTPHYYRLTPDSALHLYNLPKGMTHPHGQKETPVPTEAPTSHFPLVYLHTL